MSYFVIPLLIIGILLALIEIFLPGFGVFGISGILCITVSAVYTAVFVPFGLFVVAGELVIICLIVVITIKWAKSRQLYGNLILSDILPFEKKEAGNLEALIGKEGVTDVPLKPFGSVVFNGVKTDAYSEGPYIPKGRTVTVVNVSNDRIFVKEVN